MRKFKSLQYFIWCSFVGNPSGRPKFVVFSGGGFRVYQNDFRSIPVEWGSFLTDTISGPKRFVHLANVWANHLVQWTGFVYDEFFQCSACRGQLAHLWAFGGIHLIFSIMIHAKSAHEFSCWNGRRFAPICWTWFRNSRVAPVVTGRYPFLPCPLKLQAIHDWGTSCHHVMLQAITNQWFSCLLPRA